MTPELIDRRVLGAVRFVDATTGLRIDLPLAVEGPLTLARNRRACYAITEAPGLEAHASSFREAPTTTPIGSLAFDLTVRDPTGSYMTRAFSIALPRDPDPAHADREGSLFRVVDVPLYPSATASTGSAWAVLRVRVADAASGEGLGGALVRVVDTGGEVMARGLTDARGEGLVAVEGLDVITWGEDEEEVFADAIAARVEAIWDPGAGPVADPDDLESRRADLPSAQADVPLASGTQVAIELEIDTG